MLLIVSALRHFYVELCGLVFTALMDQRSPVAELVCDTKQKDREMTLCLSP